MQDLQYKTSLVNSTTRETLKNRRKLQISLYFFEYFPHIHNNELQVKVSLRFRSSIDRVASSRWVIRRRRGRETTVFDCRFSGHPKPTPCSLDGTGVGNAIYGSSGSQWWKPDEFNVEINTKRYNASIITRHGIPFENLYSEYCSRNSIGGTSFGIPLQIHVGSCNAQVSRATSRFLGRRGKFQGGFIGLGFGTKMLGRFKENSSKPVFRELCRIEINFARRNKDVVSRAIFSLSERMR